MRLMRMQEDKGNVFTRVREIQVFIEKPIAKDVFRTYIQEAEIKRPLAPLRRLKEFRSCFSGIALDIMAII